MSMPLYGKQVVGPAFPCLYPRGWGQFTYNLHNVQSCTPEYCSCIGVRSSLPLSCCQGELSHNAQMMGGVSSAQAQISTCPGMSARTLEAADPSCCKAIDLAVTPCISTGQDTTIVSSGISFFLVGVLFFGCCCPVCVLVMCGICGFLESYLSVVALGFLVEVVRESQRTGSSLEGKAERGC